jgi:hypothetical protein
MEELNGGVLHQRRRLTHVTLYLKPINNRWKLRKLLGVSYSRLKSYLEKSRSSRRVS